jgi:hypothetical protein
MTLLSLKSFCGIFLLCNKGSEKLSKSEILHAVQDDVLDFQSLINLFYLISSKRFVFTKSFTISL